MCCQTEDSIAIRTYPVTPAEPVYLLVLTGGTVLSWNYVTPVHFCLLHFLYSQDWSGLESSAPMKSKKIPTLLVHCPKGNRFSLI